MALETMQPVGDLCDLLGLPRYNPGVFDAMVDLVTGDDPSVSSASAEAAREDRLANLARRMTGRA